MTDSVLMDELIQVIETEKITPIKAVEIVFDKYINLMKDASSEEEFY